MCVWATNGLPARGGFVRNLSSLDQFHRRFCSPPHDYFAKNLDGICRHSIANSLFASSTDSPTAMPSPSTPPPPANTEWPEPPPSRNGGIPSSLPQPGDLELTQTGDPSYPNPAISNYHFSSRLASHAGEAAGTEIRPPRSLRHPELPHSHRQSRPNPMATYLAARYEVVT